MPDIINHTLEGCQLEKPTDSNTKSKRTKMGIDRKKQIRPFLWAKNSGNGRLRTRINISLIVVEPIAHAINLLLSTFYVLFKTYYQLISYTSFYLLTI